MTEPIASLRRWNDAYAAGDDACSWFQDRPTASLRILDAAGTTTDDSVIDIGGGCSRLVDVLLARGHQDLAVLDISDRALDAVRNRLGPLAQRVAWVSADVLSWRPDRTWTVWHDRAMLHFLTTPESRRGYVRALLAATAPGALAAIATFAPGGPDRCSGLPVVRYSPEQLAELLGQRWELVHSFREEHLTPSGASQPFTWCALRRIGE